MEESAVYANLVQIQAGPADFLLQFGIKSNRSSPNIPEEDFFLDVYLSPVTAKAMLTILANAVIAWERNNGAIPE
ncbi:DUF3467 domain-containing protein [Moorella naiadis]|uniref:DUF3467 domain-containing protein n=1 Tax=Moorella naiadis (nom. illeg.) TaxID=3093670 RepID=UPI003D9C9E58